MTCAECGRDVSPGTLAFATRVVVPTKAGRSVVLCGSCGDPAKPFGRRWALMADPNALASVAASVLPKTGPPS
jgi:hypothetical protein